MHNWEQWIEHVLIALPATILALAAFISSLAGLIQARKTGRGINGRMQELLDLVREKAAADATKAEKLAQHGREVLAIKHRRRATDK